MYSHGSTASLRIILVDKYTFRHSRLTNVFKSHDISLIQYSIELKIEQINRVGLCHNFDHYIKETKTHDSLSTHIVSVQTIEYLHHNKIM